MITLDQLIHQDIGEKGTPKRDQFELRMKILSEMIKQARK